MPIISVIVPVYNVEAYLNRCVESILAQTFSDFELILVDDGSPDRCPAMCDEWAAKDPRIRVIHKTNGGLSDARNAGFAASTGEWITFIDSDDYVHSRMLEALYDAVRNHGVKVSVCGFQETAGEPLDGSDLRPAEIRFPQDLYHNRYVKATVAWGKLYHRNIVLPYPVGKLHEDEYVTYRILFEQKKIAVVEAPLYAYFQNNCGIMRQPWNPKRMDIFPALSDQIAFFRRIGLHDLRCQRTREYMKTILRYIDMVMSMDVPAPGAIEALEKEGRTVLRRYWWDRVFTGDEDMWIYARFYPKSTQFRCTCIAIWRKLFRRS